jgi:hypothetical protein
MTYTTVDTNAVTGEVTIREWTPEEIAARQARLASMRQVPKSITRRQCALQLLAMQMITAEEALAITKDGTPPAAVDAVFANMPADQALLARIDFAAVGYYRDNPLITTMMQANGMTPEQIDQFFIAAAQL